MWLHGIGGTGADARSWLLSSLPWESCNLLELCGSPCAHMARGCFTWFEYEGQWAAHAAPGHIRSAIDRVTPAALAHAHGAKKLTIIGYNQGAAIAITLAARLRRLGLRVIVVVLRGQHEVYACDHLAEDVMWDFAVHAFLSSRDRSVPLHLAKWSLRVLRQQGCGVMRYVSRRGSHTHLTSAETARLSALVL